MHDLSLIVKGVVFTIIVPGSAAVWVPYLLLSIFPWRVGTDGFWVIGVLPITLGALTYLRCAWDFATAGKGTPAPIDPPKQLVSSRLYRVVRNPMYLGVELVLIGEAIALGSVTLLGYALLMGVLFHLFVVNVEEPNLRMRFGEAYLEYCRTVPRWVPRLTLTPRA